jgi:hypothetical protein
MFLLFVTIYRRGMAGAYPADMACKKNKFIEEWNGQREITEKRFVVTMMIVLIAPQRVTHVKLLLVALP